MKKIFPLNVEGHQPPRVIEQIKSDVRKYVKRERKKKLPEGVDFWDFDCRVGPAEASAGQKHIEELVKAIDETAASGSEAVYIEILAKPGHRLGGKKSEAP